MKRIYISSTYQDLKEYRHAIAHVLRNVGYDVDAMEKYAAREDRPKAASEADASNCDIYIGIFAWRYGFVPLESNPEGKSITELEYLAAGAAQKRRLIFLLADDAPWPATERDSEQQEDEGRRIRDLRKRLKEETWPGFFKSPDDLSKQVLTSLFQAESTKHVEGLSALDQINTADYIGTSSLSNIQQKFSQFGSVDFVAFRLGPERWWNTRLHLTAALASDFLEIRQFVLLDAKGCFLTMASPSELRRGLTKAEPKLEIAYLQSRAKGSNFFAGGEIDSIISNYESCLMEVFACQREIQIKQEVTPTMIRELGLKPQGEVLCEPLDHPLLNAEILRRSSPYVVLMRNGNLEGVVDRVELASRIAIDTLK